MKNFMIKFIILIIVILLKKHVIFEKIVINLIFIFVISKNNIFGIKFFIYNYLPKYKFFFIFLNKFILLNQKARILSN